MRVLVTGSTGLVGRAAAAHLAARGHEVVGLARGASGDPAFEAELRADLGAAGSLAGSLGGRQPCRAVVHAAAARGASPAEEIERVNRAGTARVLELAADWECERFVFISGVTVIGRPLRTPVTEDHPVDPPNVYLESKLEGERLVERAAEAGLEAAILRLTAPIGPRMPAQRIVATFVRLALAGAPLTVAGDGSRRQNYVDVHDAAAAIEAALDRPATGVFNVAGPAAISNLELAELCIAELGSSSAVELQGTDRDEGVEWDVSVERAAAKLGWVPRIAIDQSVREIATALAPATSS